MMNYEERYSTEPETVTDNYCKLYIVEDYFAPHPKAPKNYTDIDDLVSQSEKNEQRRAAMQEARGWVADSFYIEDGDTVRTIRLRKGWSQTRLANELSTSQPHVVRIERGTDNLALETCRKLCLALNIDMNALDKALKRQKTIAQQTATEK